MHWKIGINAFRYYMKLDNTGSLEQKDFLMTAAKLAAAQLRFCLVSWNEIETSLYDVYWHI